LLHGGILVYEGRLRLFVGDLLLEHHLAKSLIGSVIASVQTAADGGIGVYPYWLTVAYLVNETMRRQSFQRRRCPRRVCRPEGEASGGQQILLLRDLRAARPTANNTPIKLAERNFIIGSPARLLCRLAADGKCPIRCRL
jgi:hypothetical protein